MDPLRLDLPAPDPISIASSSSSSRPRASRPRKDKPHIALAPDQPPTTQGRPRTRVFVACVQCRGRKIRCDGAKPVCHNCSQRLAPAEECSYDAAPKRRGPDRVQGARTRTFRPKDPDGNVLSPPRRRRRHQPVHDAVAQAAGGSYAPPRTATDASLSPVSPEIPTPLSAVGHDPFVYMRDALEPPGSNVRYTSTTSYDHNLLSATVSNIPPTPQALNLPQPYYADAIGSAYIVPENGSDDSNSETSALAPEPSLEFSRKVWWDHLLTLYAPAAAADLYGYAMISQTQRDHAGRAIVADLRFLFRSSPYWFAFINTKHFYSKFLDPVRRARMQPSLILAALATATFWQSSELGRGQEGRQLAMTLRDEAQSSLEASMHVRAIDEELAQAAWLLTFFEVSCHPYHRTHRVASALHVLDSILRWLALTQLDAGNPQASAFVQQAVATVSPASASQPLPDVYGSTAQHPHSHQHAPLYAAVPCGCDALSFGHTSPESREQTPFWRGMPRWHAEWSEADVRKEECRRLCWSAMTLAAGYSSYSAAAGFTVQHLFIIDPANFHLLFPGESLVPVPYGRITGAPGKESVWALYLRAMLLWHSCVMHRQARAARAGDGDAADFTMRAWLESEAIERALDQHSCGVERTFLWSGREYLFNTRMYISFEFQRFIPHVFTGVNRDKALDWLREQGLRAKVMARNIDEVSGMARHTLVHRSHFVWWFMGQIHRALQLWTLDKTLTIALDVCDALLAPIDFLSSIYPSSEQRQRYDVILEQLRRARATAEASMGYVPRSL